MSISNSGYGDLSDGFSEVFTFRGHRGPPRGFGSVEIMEENQFVKGRRDLFVSWDLNAVFLWAREHDHPNKNPQILKTIKFNGREGLISSIILLLEDIN